MVPCLSLTRRSSIKSVNGSRWFLARRLPSTRQILLRLIYRENSDICKNNGTSPWNFALNSRLRKFRYGTSIVAAYCQLCSTVEETQCDKLERCSSVISVDCNGRLLVYHTDRSTGATTAGKLEWSSGRWLSIHFLHRFSSLQLLLFTHQPFSFAALLFLLSPKIQQAGLRKLPTVPSE